MLFRCETNFFDTLESQWSFEYRDFNSDTRIKFWWTVF